MLPFIIGGVALAVTGYGVKKYFEDENNCQEFGDAVCGWIDKVEEKTDKFFDYTNNIIDKLDEQKYGKRESCDEDELCEEVQNDKKSDDLTFQDKNTTQTKSWNKTSDWI